MNNKQLKQQLEYMQSKLEKLEKKLNEKETFKWNYSNNSYIIGSYFVDKNTMNTNDSAVAWGRCRIHRSSAEYSLHLNKETNLIGAIAEQLFPDDTWKPDWENNKQLKYYMYKKQGIYDTSATYTTKILGAHYMSEEVAEAVCKVLNSNYVKL